MLEGDFRHIVRRKSAGFFYRQFCIAIVRFQYAEELSQSFFRALRRHEQQTPIALVDLGNQHQIFVPLLPRNLVVFQRLPILSPGHIFAHISLEFLHLIQDSGSPIFRTSNEGPEPPFAEPERSF